ncbi:ornithine decarboxylase [Couchioplanes caeruleus subsp. caeruleus]|uniref:ornithine decarboxylase n=1 Tax=Couchioplanes caeruleus subsp. caeruleus TaxID=56427 RepID=A0A1K0F924_9ACTN|nr:ornithine decarboxylase [Couchioplanes caeruleus subsp. caeruleus]
MADAVGERDASAHTPCLYLDPGVAVERYEQLRAAFADTDSYYAVKANPEPRLIRRLVRAGAFFDVASPAEIALCLAEGADPSRLSYGNTVKKASDIRHAYRSGVRLFVFDSQDELLKLAEHAPGSAVFCRLLASSAGAQWPLSGKFGCTPEMAVDLLTQAPRLGLRPVGVSFHVGSQQLDPGRWEPSVATAAWVSGELAAASIELTMLNVGGGFPVEYTSPVPPIERYADAIAAAVGRHFGTQPRLATEPGRYVAAVAGVLRTEVVLVSRKTFDDDTRWVYLDVGRFGGLAETEGEAIRYRLVTPHDGRPDGAVVLAGPTCDSVDILYQRAEYRLPLALRQGDVVDILAAGAYTTTYASVGFNGFPPLPTVCIGDDE